MVGHDLSKPLSECLSPVHTTLRQEDSIEEGLAKLRVCKIEDKVIYFYVINKRNRLIGVVTVRDLLLSDPKKKIKEITNCRVVSLNIHQTLGDAFTMFHTQRLLALPIVDDEGVLLGAIDVEQYMEGSYDVGYARQRNDLFQLLGYTLEEGRRPSVFRGYQRRMPWLFCNMISGIICAIISRFNEAVLAKFLLLAFFIPLVLTLSESVSMQTMTQSLVFLRRPRFSWHQAVAKAIWEWKIVILIALTSGVIIGAVSLLWKDGMMASLTIGVGIMVGVAISSVFGIGIPILLHRTRMDPRVASGPVVLMITDVLTTLFYLSFATWLLL